MCFSVYYMCIIESVHEPGIGFTPQMLTVRSYGDKMLKRRESVALSEALTATTERVDALPLVLAQSERMGIADLLDSSFKPHGNWEGTSLGWTTVVWLAHLVIQVERQRRGGVPTGRQERPLPRRAAAQRDAFGLGSVGAAPGDAGGGRQGRRRSVVSVGDHAGEPERAGTRRALRGELQDGGAVHAGVCAHAGG